MANVIKPKRRTSNTTAPTTAELQDGEMAVNVASKQIFVRDGASIVEVANAAGSGGGYNIADLFTGGAVGIWYDPADITTLFQDAAGTVPVTAAGQPVGLMLDKSGNGVHAEQPTAGLRPVYQTGGNFSWLDPSGGRWMFVGNAAAATNYLRFTSFLGVRVGGSGQAMFVKPHADTHSSPFFRWSFWGASNWECRWNGDAASCPGAGADQVMVLDAHGVTQRSAGDFSTTGSIGPTGFSGFTYPNAVRARLFSNGGGGELFTGRFYGLVLTETALDRLTRQAVANELLAKMLS